jgi:pimeloyl-ACP methyl ester carboxylesterase
LNFTETSAHLKSSQNMPTLKIRGFNMNYEVIGDAGPYVALTTGGRRGYAEFVPLAHKLAAKGFRVLLHDRRNTGASDVVIEGEEGEEEIAADDLIALLDQLGALPAYVGGTSSGARMSMLVYLRHPKDVKGLLLIRITGGDFAAGRLPEMYYRQYIRAAQEGGMAAVCATEQYQERIKANPRNFEYLMGMDPAQYIKVMSHWLDIFLRGPRKPVLGMTDEALRSIQTPTLVVPGNDNTHASANGIAAAELINGSELYNLPIQDQDVPLLPFSAWSEQEPELAQALADFMQRVELRSK